MKNSIWIVLILVFSSLCLQGQRGSGRGSNGGGGSGPGMHRQLGIDNGVAAPTPQQTSADSLSPLKQFVNLSDKQLIAIRDVIDQILAMSPEEREALRQKIAEYEALDPEKQAYIRQGWGHVPDSARDDWHRMMQTLNNEEKDRIHEELAALPMEEKISHRLKLIEEWRNHQTKAESENQR